MSATTTAIVVLERALGPVMVDDAAQLFPDDFRDRLAMMVEELETLARVDLTKPIANPNEQAVVTEARSVASRALKQLEEWRKGAVGPLNEQVKGINAIFTKLKAPGVEFDERAERTLLAFLNAERDRVRREEAEKQRKAIEAAEAQAAATTEAEAAAASHALQVVETQHTRQAATKMRTDSGTTFVQKRLVVTIVDPALVPREWCIPNEPAIKKAALAGVAIPGVAVEEVEGLSMRVS